MGAVSLNPSCVVRSLDHIVLTVASIEDSVSFYVCQLGMSHESFRGGGTNGGQVRHAVKFGNQKINLHQRGKEFEPKAQTALPGTADLCFLTLDPVERVRANLEAKGIEVLELEEGSKVVERTGATRKLRSIYVRDPDGNLVEYV